MSLPAWSFYQKERRRNQKRQSEDSPKDGPELMNYCVEDTRRPAARTIGAARYIPSKGMIVLDMGTNPLVPSALAEALFSSVQRRVLTLLFGHPERSFQSAEVIRLVRGGTGGVHRELRRLEKAGWLTVARIGNQKHYQAHRACPGFHELHGLVVKTLGVAWPAEQEARPSPHRSSKPRPAPAAKNIVRQVPTPKPGPDEQRSASAPEPRPTPNDGWKAW
jgi:hypothetical protein